MGQFVGWRATLTRPVGACLRGSSVSPLVRRGSSSLSVLPGRRCRRHRPDARSCRPSPILGSSAGSVGDYCAIALFSSSSPPPPFSREGAASGLTHEAYLCL